MLFEQILANGHTIGAKVMPKWCQKSRDVNVRNPPLWAMAFDGAKVCQNGTQMGQHWADKVVPVKE
jgi:hypothetical protein